MIQLYKIYGYKDRSEKRFYVTWEDGIFPLYCDNAALNLLKKPWLTGTCALGEIGEPPVWEKGTTNAVSPEDDRKPSSANWKHRETGGVTHRELSWQDRTALLAGKCCCAPLPNLLTRPAFSDVLGEGKTSLHLLICRLLYRFITLSDLFKKKKKDRGKTGCSSLKNFESMFKSNYLMQSKVHMSRREFVHMKPTKNENHF